MTDTIFNVLFVCGDNATLSIMAEKLLARLGGNRFHAYSAGFRPTRSIHPLTLEVMEMAGLDTDRLYPKSCQAFKGFGAPTLDFVFHLTGDSACAQSYGWNGKPIVANWTQDDPRRETGNEAERLQAFRDSFNLLRRRIELFVTAQYSGMTRNEAIRRVARVAGSDRRTAASAA